MVDVANTRRLGETVGDLESAGRWSAISASSPCGRQSLDGLRTERPNNAGEI